MAQYTIVKNGVVDNVIEATEEYIIENHNNDIAILGSVPIGYLFKDDHFIPPETLPIDVNDIVGVPSHKPVLPLSNLSIASPATLTGNIYWLAKDTDAVVTGDLALPDGDYMIMAERVVNAKTVVDDVRFVATIASGVFTMTVNFPIPGNYLLSAKRMNEGLDRIGSSVHLSFDDVEFDIFV
ncbi:hypothetical protein [Colwellia sp. E150_009]